MKTVKSLLFLLSVLIFTSCQTKQEEARNNLSKTWKIQSVTRDGSDYTSTYVQNRANYRISFTKDGAFQETYRTFGAATETTVNGSYSINSNITELNLDSDLQSRAYTIDMLEEANMNLTDLGSNNDLKIFLVPS